MTNQNQTTPNDKKTTIVEKRTTTIQLIYLHTNVTGNLLTLASPL